MPSFEIAGKLHKIYPTEQKTETFSAREFVLEVNEGNYMQYVKFQLTQDRCGLVDQMTEGQDVNVHFDLRGREWNGKFFTNLNAWKIEKPVNAEAPKAENDDFFFPEAESPNGADESVDDLPF